ncbi:MAG: hypothetical protein HKN91_03710, partial [Acidimicrobiia bacterium]|nr:hypothetical protein [Acidimicrobiia bacterium]
MPRRTFIALLATAIVVASCGGAEPPSRQVDTTIEAAVGTTITAVTTVAPGSSAQPTESTAIEPVEEWELVVFGDSFASKSGWPEQYAEMVGDEFGVAVSVGGAVCFGGCTGLDRIRGSDGLQAEIATAEFVVIQPQPGRVVAPLWRLYAAGDCGGDDGLACFRQAEADFRVYVEDLLDEVIELSGQGVVIRTMQATGTWALDSFHPGLRDSAPEQF